MPLPDTLAMAFMFLQNGALLALGVLGACQLRSFTEGRKPVWLTPLVSGLLMGGVGIVCMLAAIVSGHGVRLDLRNAVVIVATLCGGIRTGTVTLLVLGGFRLSLGGDGLLTGLAGLAISYLGGAFGVAAQRRLRRRLHWAEAAWLTFLTQLVFTWLMPLPLLVPGMPETQVLWLASVTAAASFLALVTNQHEQSRGLLGSLRRSEERFRALIEHSTDSLRVLTAEGKIRDRYRSSALSLGYSEEEATGSSVFDYAHPDDLPELRKRFEEILASPGLQRSGRTRLRHHDGSWRVVAWSARNALNVPGVEGIILNGRDETEAFRLEEQLRQAQKMEAVGRLAGGIAHDFNNLLGGIMGFVGFLLEDLPRESEQWRFARRIKTASERARDLVAQILAFSRLSSVERAPLDLRKVARETRALLRASLPSSTEIELLLPEAPLVVDANAGQISQILLNLCVNANDALDGEPGRIAVRLTPADAGDLDHAEFQETATSGGGGQAEAHGRTGTVGSTRAYARIDVADTGCGMDFATVERIFDPFFTTKPTGQGTGLGLSVVHGTVLAYDGACVVKSRAGSGTRIIVYLPLSAESLPARPALDTSEARGKERILVIDDEPVLCDMLRTGLERLDYKVTSINDPKEALARFMDAPTQWDVVITDQVMPGMLGLGLIERMVRTNPSPTFILCSGCDDPAVETRAHALGACFFMKPVSPERLARAIREATSDATAQ